MTFWKSNAWMVVPLILNVGSISVVSSNTSVPAADGVYPTEYPKDTYTDEIERPKILNTGYDLGTKVQPLQAAYGKPGHVFQEVKSSYGNLKDDVIIEEAKIPSLYFEDSKPFYESSRIGIDKLKSAYEIPASITDDVKPSYKIPTVLEEIGETTYQNPFTEVIGTKTLHEIPHPEKGKTSYEYPEEENTPYKLSNIEEGRKVYEYPKIEYPKTLYENPKIEKEKSPYEYPKIEEVRKPYENFKYEDPRALYENPKVEEAKTPYKYPIIEEIKVPYGTVESAVNPYRTSEISRTYERLDTKRPVLPFFSQSYSDSTFHDGLQNSFNDMLNERTWNPLNTETQSGLQKARQIPQVLYSTSSKTSQVYDKYPITPHTSTSGSSFFPTYESGDLSKEEGKYLSQSKPSLMSLAVECTKSISVATEVLTPILKKMVEDSTGKNAVDICKISKARILATSASHTLSSNFIHFVKLDDNRGDRDSRYKAYQAFKSLQETMSEIRRDLPAFSLQSFEEHIGNIDQLCLQAIHLVNFNQGKTNEYD